VTTEKVKLSLRGLASILLAFPLHPAFGAVRKEEVMK
jgi:hypothetical protein